MSIGNITNHPHRRKNILTGEWVLVSPNRVERPWQGEVENEATKQLPEYEPKCYLCPDNERAGGRKNDNYSDTFVFVNDFSSLNFDTPQNYYNNNDFLVAEPEQGICKVICFSPYHNLSLAELHVNKIKNVVDAWQKEYIELGNLDEINHVQIFENKGGMMGCSNPHPHGQIWAQHTIPDIVTKESTNLRSYFSRYRSTLLGDYIKLELQEKERIVYENEHFVSLVPFWAVWPFETMIISKENIQSIKEMNDEEKYSFAEIIKVTTIKYDNIFNISFPYSAGIHQAPTDGNDNQHWHFHMHFYPPLLRSASIKKFMVGYEMLANPQRDITAEYSAKLLRELSDEHYNNKKFSIKKKS